MNVLECFLQNIWWLQIVRRFQAVSAGFRCFHVVLFFMKYLLPLSSYSYYHFHFDSDLLLLIADCLTFLKKQFVNLKFVLYFPKINLPADEFYHSSLLLLFQFWVFLAQTVKYFKFVETLYKTGPFKMRLLNCTF